MLKKFFNYQKISVEIILPNLFCKYLPLICLELFLTLGYIFYLYGPWHFPLRYDIKTMIFVISCHLMLAIGYFLAVRKKIYISTFNIDTINLCKILLIIGTLGFFVYCKYRTGSFIPPIFSSLEQLGEAYYRIEQMIKNNSNGILYQCISSLMLIFYAITVTIFYFFNQVPLHYKIVGIVLSILYLSIEISVGKSLGVCIIVLTIILLYFIKLFSGELKGRSFVIYSFFTLLSLIFICFFFVYNLQARTYYSPDNEVTYSDSKKEVTPSDINFVADLADNSVYAQSNFPGFSANQIYNLAEEYYSFDDLPDYYQNPSLLSYVHVDDPIYSSLPQNLKFGYAMGSMYFSHGYAGLTLALQQDFTPCFGLGHLKTFENYIYKIFNIKPNVITYEEKLQSVGYPVGLYWMTVYPQFASDFTFLGTILLMILMGGLLGTLWLEVTTKANIISLVFFTFYCIQFFFFTSWWYPGLSGSFFVTFYVPMFLWLILKYFNFKSLQLLILKIKG